MRKIQLAETVMTPYVSPMCENLDLISEGVICDSGLSNDPLVEVQEWEFIS